DNRPPSASTDGPFTMLEDSEIYIPFSELLSNDSDPDGDPIEVVDAYGTNSTLGLIELVGDSVRYVPSEDRFGTVFLIYKISDGNQGPGSTEIANIIIDIENVPDFPTTGADGPYTTTKNTPIAISIDELLSNDDDADGDSIYLFESIAPENGTLTVTDEFIIFKPDLDYVGVEGLFAYTITDGTGRFATRNVAVIVDDGPLSFNGTFSIIAKEDASQVFAVNETSNRSLVKAQNKSCSSNDEFILSDFGNGYHTIINVFSDKAVEGWQRTPRNGDPVSIYSLNNRDWQQWEIIPAGNGFFKIKGKYNTRFITKQGSDLVLLNENGQDNQLWEIRDINAANCPNLAPVAISDGGYTVDEDGQLAIPFDNLLQNDFDPDGDPISIVDAYGTNSQLGVIELFRGNVVYYPSENLNGSVTLIYKISDGELSSIANIFININPVNDPPFTEADGPFMTTQNTSVAISIDQLLSNDGDVDGDDITFFEAVAPVNGSLEVTSTEVIFTPDTDYVGNGGLFAYTITDGNGRFATRNVAVIVNEAPMSFDDGNYFISPKGNPNEVLYINSANNRTPLEIHSKECSSNENWLIEAYGDYFRFINQFANKAMEGWQRSPANGDPVTIYSWNRRDWQQWELEADGNGYYKIKGKFNPRYVTLDDGEIKLLNANNTDSQLWELLPFGCAQPIRQQQSKPVTSSFNVFPNPVDKVLNLSGELNYANLTIKNLNGQTILESHLGESYFTQLNVDHLSPGMYILFIELDGVLFKSKFTKM
ncbi:MAG: tandem-95 repeat protein, partial [Bacteroidota bacterium]